MEYFGHSENDEGKGVPDLLVDHLNSVVDLSKGFATFFGAGDYANVAGLLHDLGKYADQFQRRLKSPKQEAGRDHSTAGMAIVLKCYKHLGEAAALVIEGHHRGLKSLQTYKEKLNEIAKDSKEIPDRFTDTNLALLFDRFKSDGLTLPPLDSNAHFKFLHDLNRSASAMLDVRLLFSALVDADFIDTEAHFSGNAKHPRIYRPEGPALPIDDCLKRLERFIVSLQEENTSNQDIQDIRDRLMQSCLESASHPTGLFTLTAPTGAGKTLAMLAFALEHARQHHLRRIVLVMPYLNIIEQTAKVYEKLFGPLLGFDEHLVMEDHSLAALSCGHQDNSEQSTNHTRKLLAENWDAPIILTTSVKCLESLMANRPGACRKLHRLAQSVILFDEVQTLPPKLIVPTLATLSRLADPAGPYGCSVVFSTATQPAFDHLHDRVAELNPTGWRPREIVSHTKPMFAKAAKRIEINWRHQTPITVNQLSQELLELDQVLCIVNLKRHAIELAQTLHDTDPNRLFHLSTNMCPAHRRKVLDEVQIYLDNNQPVRLIATQCVEAGVDLDFPAVYRALAPLDSIAQAAGRCNRHGIRPKPGKVTVFQFKSDGKGLFPPGYKEGVSNTEIFLNNLASGPNALDDIEIFNAPDLLRQYYQQLYDLGSRGTGVREDEKELRNALNEGDFEKVAKAYKLIEQDAINVLVPYQPDLFQDLMEQIQSDAPRNLEWVRQWIHQAKPCTVSIYRPHIDKPIYSVINPIQFSRHREREEDQVNWFYLLETGRYNDLTGLEVPDDWLIF